jgi:hypothetical protein
MKSTFSAFVKSIGDAVASAAGAASMAVETSLAAAGAPTEKARHSGPECGKSADDAMWNAAHATSDFVSEVGGSISESEARQLDGVEYSGLS